MSPGVPSESGPSKRRARRRRTALVLLGALGLASCRPTEHVDLSGLELKLDVGVGNAAMAGDWSTATVQLSGAPAELRGTIEVAQPSPRGAARTTWRREFTLPPEARRRFAVPVVVEPWSDFTVVVRSGSSRRAWTAPLLAAAQRTEETADFLLVVGERVPDLDPLADLLERRSPPQPNPGMLSSGPKREAHVISTPAAGLPTHELGLAPFRLVVLWRDSLARVADVGGALDALERWVRRGGTLVVFPGPDWSSTVPPELLEMAGISRVLPDVPPPFGWEDVLRSVGTPGAWRTLEVADDTTRSAGGLVVTHGHGAGVVHSFSWTPAAPELPDPNRAPFLYDPLLDAWNRGGSFAANGARRVPRLDDALARTLSGRTGFRFPPRRAVAVALSIYLLVGFLVPWLVFRWLRRPEWTYAAIVVAAVVATWLIYERGAVSGLPRTRYDEITLVRQRAGSSVASASTLLAWTSPTYRTLGVPLPRGDTWRAVSVRPAAFVAVDPRLMALENRTLSPFDVVFDEYGRPADARLRLVPNAPSFARVDWLADDLPGGVELELSSSGDGGRSLTLELENPSDTWAAYALLEDDRWSGPPAALGPGATRRLVWPPPASFTEVSGGDLFDEHRVVLWAVGASPETFAAATSAQRWPRHLSDGPSSRLRSPRIHGSAARCLVVWMERPTYPTVPPGGERHGTTYWVHELPPWPR